MKNWNDVRSYMENDTPLSKIPEGTELVPVVGVSFIKNYPDNILKLQQRYLYSSEPIMANLKRNPQNKYDRNAIEVYVDGEMLGHLPKEVAARVAPPMDNGINYNVRIFQVRISPENSRNPGLDILLEEL